MDNGKPRQLKICNERAYTLLEQFSKKTGIPLVLKKNLFNLEIAFLMGSSMRCPERSGIRLREDTAPRAESAGEEDQAIIEKFEKLSTNGLADVENMSGV